MSQTASATVSKADTLALALSISPIALIWSSRARFGLDALHVGLLQIVLLLVLRAALDLLPTSFRRRTTADSPRALASSAASAGASASSPTRAAVTVATPALPILQNGSGAELVVPEGAAVVVRPRREKVRRRMKRAVPVELPPAFPAEKLDEVVANFLHITEPAYLNLVPSPPTSRIPAATLSSWKTTYTGGNIEVLQHPTIASLYAISATFADIPLAKLFQALQDINHRPKWDSMCAGAREIERFEVDGRRGNVLTMQMKGMPLVKAKDLVLLSVAGTLPAVETDPAGKRRIFAASTSVEHPACPVTPAFNRMSLGVSGFIIDEVDVGSRIVQITDLSGLGSWMPSAVFRTITETLLPMSLAKLGAAAAAVQTVPIDFPPPVLGAPRGPTQADADSEWSSGDDDEDLSDLEDEIERGNAPGTSAGPDGFADAPFPSSNNDVPALAPSVSRDLHALLTQLRTLSTRLATLESIVESPGTRNRWWWLPFSRGRTTGGTGRGQDRIAGTEVITGTEGAGIGLAKVLTMGSLSAAAAAVAVAAVAAWGRHKR